jgi:hypothetical protein
LNLWDVFVIQFVIKQWSRFSHKMNAYW